MTWTLCRLLAYQHICRYAEMTSTDRPAINSIPLQGGFKLPLHTMSDSDYCIRIRRGKVIHVHKQVLLWRKRRRAALRKQREAEEKAAQETQGNSPKRFKNFFTDEE